MTDDPIVQEVRQAREAYAARFNYDLAAMVADLQRRTEEARRAGREVVVPRPRPVEPCRPPAAPAGQAE
jgi:hypothetical protein